MAVSANRFGRLRMPIISLYFHTEHSYFKVTDDTTTSQPTSIEKGSVEPSVISFKTTNSMSDDSATFSIVLGPKSGVLWDRVINENDLVEIYIDNNESLLSGDSTTKNNTAVMVGLVSEVAIMADHSSDQKMYQITGQSIAKVFSQFKVGMVSEIEEQMSPMGWLWDSAISEAYYTTGGGGDTSDTSDDGDDSGSGSGESGSNSGYSATDKKRAGTASDYKSSGSTTKAKLISLTKQIGKRLGINWKYLAGQLGSETGFGSSGSAQDNNYTGIKYAGQSGATKGSKVGDSSGGYYAHFASDSDWAVEYARIIASDDRKSGYKMSKATTVAQFCAALKEEGYFTASLSSYTKLMEGVIAGLGGKGSSSSSSGSSDTSDDSDSSSSGVGGMTPDQIALEKGHSEGISFYGNNVATVETNVLTRFEKYIKLSYENGAHDIWDYLDTNGFDSWTEWEKMKDSSSFTNFSGSLYELQKALLRQPFNEMFYDFQTNNGAQVAKLIIRRTPFDPEDWYALDMVNIDSSNVLSEQISKTDREQYSVFVDNPASGWFSGAQDTLHIGSNPRTNEDMIKTYGYSKLEVSDYYISGANDTDWSVGSSGSDDYDKGDITSSNNEKGEKYDFKKTLAFLNKYNRTSIDQQHADVSYALAQAANNISLAQASKLVSNYANNGYTLTQTLYNECLNTDNGGGQANTGTHKITYKKVNSFIKQSNSVSDFLTFGKKYFKNVSDEELTAIYNASENGKITKTAYDKAIKSYSKTKTGETDSGSLLDTDTFQMKLYNWYANNLNFWSGTYTITGNPNVRLGMILNYSDNYLANSFKYPGRRFYIESVSHNFSFTEGFTTDVGVTRGLIAPASLTGQNDPRFTETYNWGNSVPYKGGYMGEARLKYLALNEGTDSSDDADADGGSASGPEAAVKAVKFGKQFEKSRYKAKTEIYAFGGPGERGSTNPLTHSINGNNLILDCSSFTYWCFKHVGITTGTTTWHQRDDSQFKKIKVPSNSTKGMKVGDLVMLYNCGHVMFYVGDGKLMGWNGGSGGKAAWDTSGGCKIVPLSAMGNHDGYAYRLKG